MEQLSTRDAATHLARAVSDVVGAGPGQIGPSTSTRLVDVDSLEHAEIIFAFEGHAEVSLDDRALSTFMSLWSNGATLETIAAGVSSDSGGR